MKDFLFDIDLLSLPISLKYKNRSSHGNLIGGILTIIICIMCVGVSIYFSLEVIERVNPKAFIISRFTDNAGALNFNKQGLAHFIYLRNPVNEITKFDSRAINVTG